MKEPGSYSRGEKQKTVFLISRSRLRRRQGKESGERKECIR